VFGEVRNGQMVLNECGRIANECWKAIPDHFPHVELDEYIIMPNHVHGIIKIVGAPFMGALNHHVGAPDQNDGVVYDINMKNGDNNGNELIRAPIKGAPTLGHIIGAFKSITTNEYIKHVKCDEWPPFDKRFWQRNYYEHVIRSCFDLSRIREYIVNNPAELKNDRYFIVS